MLLTTLTERLAWRHRSGVKKDAEVTSSFGMAEWIGVKISGHTHELTQEWPLEPLAKL
jgi:hypothetical protein